ncbi:hypothetical protein Cgig2_009019 [Carnegiea gigantea]|uniref:Uncharacterized protein n=1 Tax=Carnegiea gigantea TaxID=171969 RepID=A0A9Q1KEB1_9CARY|nr:hypothetical protein Cgig2_009019 [Carnegiea gigantea]
MLLNEAERLGVLQRWALQSFESALIELRWSTFESWVWLYGDRIFEAQFCPKESVDRKRSQKWSRRMRAQPLKRRPPLRMRDRSVPLFSLAIMAFPPIYNMREMVNYVRESFIWCWRSASRPPCPLPEDFHALCSCFSLSEVEGTAIDFELPEIVQAKFYAMLLNEAVELVVAHDFTAESMKSSLIRLRWSTFEVWVGCVGHVLRVMQLQQLADEMEIRGSLDGQKEASGSNGPPAPSSEEE